MARVLLLSSPRGHGLTDSIPSAGQGAGRTIRTVAPARRVGSPRRGVKVSGATTATPSRFGGRLLVNVHDRSVGCPNLRSVTTTAHATDQSGAWTIRDMSALSINEARPLL